MQPECVAVEWNSVRTPGPAETEEWKAKDAVKKAEGKAKKEALAKQKEAEKKAAAQKKKKKKKKRAGSNEKA